MADQLWMVDLIDRTAAPAQDRGVGPVAYSVLFVTEGASRDEGWRVGQVVARALELADPSPHGRWSRLTALDAVSWTPAEDRVAHVGTLAGLSHQADPT